jgi:hypothetical protein
VHTSPSRPPINIVFVRKRFMQQRRGPNSVLEPRRGEAYPGFTQSGAVSLFFDLRGLHPFRQRIHAAYPARSRGRLSEGARVRPPAAL